MLVGVVSGHYEYQHREDSFFLGPRWLLFLQAGIAGAAAWWFFIREGEGDQIPDVSRHFLIQFPSGSDPQNWTITPLKPGLLHGSNHLVHFWKLSKRPFLLNRTTSTDPLAQKKDLLAQYTAKTADPSCPIGVHNVYVFSVSITTWTHLATSSVKKTLLPIAHL